MSELILVLAKSDEATLGSVRCLPGILAAERSDLIWLRMPGERIKDVRGLPSQHSYTLDEANRLFPFNSLTPTGTLPELDWRSLPDLIPVELPVPARPGEVKEQIPIGLIPSEKAQPGAALLLSLEAWKNYVEGAPAVRLRSLRFALAEDGRVLIMGEPLPPVPGQEYWLEQGNLLPAGYQFDLPQIATLIQGEHNPYGEDVLLFDREGNWEKISKNNWVPVSRSAVRLSKLPNHHE